MFLGSCAACILFSALFCSGVNNLFTCVSDVHARTLIDLFVRLSVCACHGRTTALLFHTGALTGSVGLTQTQTFDVYVGLASSYLTHKYVVCVCVSLLLFAYVCLLLLCVAFVLFVFVLYNVYILSFSFCFTDLFVFRRSSFVSEQGHIRNHTTHNHPNRGLCFNSQLHHCFRLGKFRHCCHNSHCVVTAGVGSIRQGGNYAVTITTIVQYL